jgi:hypothetical protein
MRKQYFNMLVTAAILLSLLIVAGYIPFSFCFILPDVVHERQDFGRDTSFPEVCTSGGRRGIDMA